MPHLAGLIVNGLLLGGATVTLGPEIGRASCRERV